MARSSSTLANIVAALLAGAAGGLVAGLVLGSRSGGADPGDDGDGLLTHQAAAPSVLPHPRWQAELQQVHDALDVIRRMIAEQRQGDRLPVYSDVPSKSEPATIASTTTATSDERLRRIELELEAIRETIKEQVWVQRPPAIEQLRAAPQSPVWAEVRTYYEQLFSRVPEESLVGKSYDEILSRFGLPSEMGPTKWYYVQPGSGGFRLEFVNGYVGSVASF